MGTVNGYRKGAEPRLSLRVVRRPWPSLLLSPVLQVRVLRVDPRICPESTGHPGGSSLIRVRSRAEKWSAGTQSGVG
jgi:hypothetical protein